MSEQEDGLGQYLAEIREVPRLTAEQERELARRCAEGDEEAVRQMVIANLRLVVSVARAYTGQGAALLDLIQEGSIGLLTAARKFDYTKELRFSTYATKWIRQGVTQFLANRAGTIRVPQHTADRMRKISAARKALLQENGEEPTPEELAAITAIPAPKVQELLGLMPEVWSLNLPMGEKSTLADVLEDFQTPEPQETVVRGELESILQTMLDMLTPRQQRVLRLHFGMEDGRAYSLEEIGSLLGISKERARQIERQAIQRLQDLGASFGLEEFLE